MPIGCPLEGPKEPAKKNNHDVEPSEIWVPASCHLLPTTCIHACPEGAIISRSGTEKWVPDRVPIWVPLWGAH